MLGFDYTGCYTSEGKVFGGYTQSVYDLDSILTYCDNNASFSNMPIYLFGHSMGGYAVTAVLNYNHRVDAVVSASGINSVDILVLIISADTDVFYNGKRSAIYEKRDMIINENFEFMLMDKSNHNEHYTYFLTYAALEYRESNSSENIDKELYMERDEQILCMIIGFFDEKN